MGDEESKLRYGQSPPVQRERYGVPFPPPDSPEPAQVAPDKVGESEADPNGVGEPPGETKDEADAQASAGSEDPE